MVTVLPEVDTDQPSPEYDAFAATGKLTVVVCPAGTEIGAEIAARASSTDTPPGNACAAGEATTAPAEAPRPRMHAAATDAAKRRLAINPACGAAVALVALKTLWPRAWLREEFT